MKKNIFDNNTMSRYIFSAKIPLQTQENKIVEVFRAEMTKELNDSMSQIQASTEQGIKTFSIIYVSYTDRIREMSLPSIVINIELDLNREDAAFIENLGNRVFDEIDSSIRNKILNSMNVGLVVDYKTTDPYIAKVLYSKG